jgi:hypothetical protein
MCAHLVSASIVRKSREASESTIYNHPGILHSRQIAAFMRIQSLIPAFCVLLLFPTSLAGQSKRVWVLRAPGAAVEYDPATFAEMRTVKVPAEAVRSPQNFSVNPMGQMLFAEPAALPLAEGDLAAEQKVWFWDGRSAATLVREVARTTATAGSNLSIAESAPVPYLSADGSHLYWFANQARRLAARWRGSLHQDDLAKLADRSLRCGT